VAWLDVTNLDDRRARVRMSTNDGQTFTVAKTVARGPRIGGPLVAIGNGVVHVVFQGAAGVMARRSTSAGSTWTAARVIAPDATTDPDRQPSIAAGGKQAYVAYESMYGHVRYTRTADKGATWSPPRSLAPRPVAPDYRISGTPTVRLSDGIARLVYARDASGSQTVYYRETADGATWTNPDPVAEGAFPFGVGWAGRPIVAYREFEDMHLYACTRVP
jgi:hypothetical protein